MGHEEHHEDHDHGGHNHEGHEHGHGHAKDQGPAAIIRYLRHAPDMWRSEVNDAVIELVGPLATERVLDIGAGMGAGTMRAAAVGAEVVAVDPTPFMRLILRTRRLFQRARKKITVVAGAAERLPVPDRSIDALWAVNTMHHWVDVDRGVGEIARVLRPGGRIVLVDEDFDDPEHPDYERFRDRHKADDEAEEKDGNHHGFSMVDATDMADKLRGAGLVAVETDKQKLVGRPVIAVTASAAGSATAE